MLPLQRQFPFTAIDVARFHVLEHFVLFRTHGDALSFCFYAIPDAKPLSHFCWNSSRTADDFMTDID
ncbi:hypothetical protein ELI02_26005 (plasmid) [Rhizobium leguminosarum]|uniref:Uncharacterized protein n=1 Tax=Rhizobium leguminosarum TaxID=384 RepID=A0A4Q8XSJ4_RHILE|nr:hypothetical protein ELI40_26925 [Rhizobium leguminosarum]TAX04539.1 hypothetical protein ELI07_28940 [Rhizobium leguminosarum]TAX47477.1 hypothetical protein ELI02_26005 [Rhizobium leguminosarum]TAX47830.1 hypothetical protein ELI01_26755 [Rhizobium leguminosarum]TAX68036.1 hypothetical protein ELI03_28540 [Rhizobium leguminosarum]